MPSARSSTRIRASISAPKISQDEHPRDWGARDQREAGDLARDGDVVRMAQEAVRTAQRFAAIRAARGRETSSGWPSVAMAQYFSALAAAKTIAPDTAVGRSGCAAQPALGEHRQKRSGYAICISA